MLDHEQLKANWRGGMGPKRLSFCPGPAPMRSWTDGSLLWKLSVTLGRFTERNSSTGVLLSTRFASSLWVVAVPTVGLCVCLPPE